MRFRRTLAVVLICCGCLAGSANAGQMVKLKVAFAPDRLGARTTIGLALRIGGTGGASPLAVTSLDLRLPAGIGIATTTLGQDNCEPVRLFVSGLEGCSANARIGYGMATVVVPIDTQPVHEKALLYALMGPPAENRLEVLFYIAAKAPVFAQLVLPSVVEEASAPYGEDLATAIPLIQAWPEGPNLALETFSTTIGPLHLLYHRKVRGRTVAYRPRGIRLPRGCPANGFPFAAVARFVDGTQTTGFYRVPCPRR